MDKKQTASLLIAGLFLIAIFCIFKFSGKKQIILENPTDNVGIQNQQDSQQQETKTEQENKTEKESDVQNVEQQSQQAQKSPADKQEEENKEDSGSNERIIDKKVNWGFEKSDSRKIDTIIIHSNYNKTSDDPYDINGAISQFKTYSVAAHYLIGRDGKIYKLVDEKNIAYHAGVSKVPDGRTNVNDFSIGIELMTKESGDHPTDKQYDALNWLISDIKKRYSIKYVLGHKDIAPGRKSDPWGFDWDKVNK